MEGLSLSVLAEKHDRLVVKYNNLHKLYRDLKQDHAKCEEWMARYYEKYNGMKECVKAWQVYIDKQCQPARTSEIPSSPTKDAVTKRASPRVTSSQTTEGEQESSPATTNEPISDGEPEVVKSRSLKRKTNHSTRAVAAPVRIKEEGPNSPENPIHLMSEDYSSPVLERKKFVRMETSDLDAYIPTMDTPRKRRRQQGTSGEKTTPAPLPLNLSSRSDGDLPSMLRTSTENDIEAGRRCTDDDPSVTARDFAVNSSAETGSSNALRARSANISGSARSSSTRQLVSSKPDRQDKRKIAILSEDGDDHDSKEAGPAAEIDDGVKRRLGNLLDEPTPGKQPLSGLRTPLSTSSRTRESRPRSKEKRAKDVPMTKNLYEYRTPLGLERPPPAPLPEEEPLRSRPLPKLGLDDFRINPKFMGVDFAFSETFRGREQRRCLPGCTKPGCCGNVFRKAVEIGALQSTKSDTQVLEEYLGPDFDQILANHAPEKRKDLLMEARAQAMANQYGRHRNAYDRPASPPGFWRIDMPTTQEAEEDRAKSHNMERKKVEERWREAMRDGGRWLFRDE